MAFKLVSTPNIGDSVLIKDVNGVEWPHKFVRDWWLRSLLFKFGDFKIAYSWGLNKYSKWVGYYPGLFIEKDCVEREVLSNELLFDFDHDDFKQNVIGAKLLVKRLETHKLGYYCFFSGNKGIHISVFFDKGLIKFKYPELIIKSIKYGLSFKDVLKVYYYELIGDLFCGDFIDSPLMDYKTHLVRVVGSINYKSGMFKTYFGELGYAKPFHLSFVEVRPSILNVVVNDLDCFSRIVNSLIQSKQSVEVLVDGSDQVRLSRFFSDKPKSVIGDLFNIRLIDGRKRFVVFVLIPSLVNGGFNKLEVTERIKNWLAACGHSGSGIDIGYLYDYCKRKRSNVNYSLIKEFKRLGFVK